MAQPNQTRRIKAIRGFRFRGRVVGPGSVLDVNMTEFSDLVSSGKAVKVDPDTKLSETDELPTPTGPDQPPAETPPQASGTSKASGK